jgi:hypothetical protein
MDWRRGSRGRDPTLQAGSPEFKLQSHQKKKKITNSSGKELTELVEERKESLWGN